MKTKPVDNISTKTYPTGDWDERFVKLCNNLDIWENEAKYIRAFIRSEIKKAYQQGFEDGNTRKQLREKV